MRDKLYAFLNKLGAKYRWAVIKPRDCWMYYIILVFTHMTQFLAVYTGIIAVTLWNTKFPDIPVPAVMFSIWNFCVSRILVSALIIFLFFRKLGFAQDHYEKSGDRFLWLKKCMMLIVPGEILRYLLAFLPIHGLGEINSPMQIMTKGMHILLTDICITLNDKIGSYVHFEGSDYLRYTGLHFLYLIAIIPIVCLIYHHFWNKTAEEEPAS